MRELHFQSNIVHDNKLSLNPPLGIENDIFMINKNAFIEKIQADNISLIVVFTNNQENSNFRRNKIIVVEVILSIIHSCLD